MPQPTGCTAPPRPDHSRVASASSAVAQRLMDEIAKPNGQFMIVPSPFPLPTLRAGPHQLPFPEECTSRANSVAIAGALPANAASPVGSRTSLLKYCFPGWVNSA